MDDWPSRTHGVVGLRYWFGVEEMVWFGAGQRKLMKLGMPTRQSSGAKTNIALSPGASLSLTNVSTRVRSRAAAVVRHKVVSERYKVYILTRSWDRTKNI
jgi:hypothetical protein